MNEEKNNIQRTLGRIEGIVSQMNERLNHSGEAIRDIRNEIKSNFKWTLGIFIAMWLSVILTVLFK